MENLRALGINSVTRSSNSCPVLPCYLHFLWFSLASFFLHFHFASFQHPPSACPFFFLFHSFFQSSLFPLRNISCCCSYLASRKSRFWPWELLWLWGHWIWPVEVSRRNTWYVDILRWSCQDGCLEHCLIWQYLLSLQFRLKRKTVHLGSKATTSSLDLVLWRKALFYKRIVKWLAIIEDNTLLICDDFLRLLNFQAWWKQSPLVKPELFR